MLSYKRAETEFQKYIKDYDAYNDKIGTKIKHIFGVVHFAEQIAMDLNLSEEDIELAKIIALLHDIGRFEQITIYDSFIDGETVDHADLGVQMLKNESLIRKFACDERFDNVIFKAIANHNKLRIEDGLTEDELLHSKIIRDADKMDNFIILPKTNMAYLSIDVSEEIVGSQAISDEVFEGFMRCECLERSVLKNGIDKWIYHITWIFDLNQPFCFKYIRDKGIIDLFIDRFDYKNQETIERMKAIRQCANRFVQEESGRKA